MTDRTGQAAVAFSLPDATGVTHEVSDFHGRWLLMVFHRHLG